MLQNFLSENSLKLNTPQTAEHYQGAEGFPHIMIDNFLNAETAEAALKNFPAVGDSTWINYLHYNEKKYGLNKREALPPTLLALIDKLNSPEFIAYLSEITGIKNLIADPMLEGGGLHQIPPGGFLNLHADFTAHPHHRFWRRRINLLIYLNKNWLEEYGGNLELWTRDMKRMFRKIPPLFNRCVIFNTDKDTFHGHPDPLKCPEDMTRKSIALYYFTEEESLPLKKATNYQARPHEGMLKSVLILLDKKALSVYNWLKGVLNIDDALVSKILKFLSGGKK